MPKPVNNSRKAFITGSSAYGVCRATSDVDLVVEMSQRTCNKLMEISESQDSLIFGDLNIIPVDKEQYEFWAEAKRRCLAVKLVKGALTRERAIEIHKEVAKRLEITHRALIEYDDE